MRSTRCALDTLTTSATYVAGRLASIEAAVATFSEGMSSQRTEHVRRALKDLHNELTSALSKADDATTTGRRISGKTK